MIIILVLEVVNFILIKLILAGVMRSVAKHNSWFTGSHYELRSVAE
jgi:hypothetical protein